MIFDAKTYFGFYINLLPQALTGVNTWMNWILFLSFFISILTYIEACLNDIETNIIAICKENNNDDVIQYQNSDLILNQTIELHAELTK